MTDEIDELPGPPPIICVNDRVLLQYAVLNDSVGFNAGHGLMFVGDKEIGRVPFLAICQDKDSPQVTLYYCNRDWSPIGIAGYDSVAAAKKKAERIYPGSSACWSEAQFTEEDVNRYLDGMKTMHYLAVQIVRFVDSSQPGWVECEFVDAEGRRHVFKNKVPIFTVEDLGAESKYPTPGVVCCEVLERYQNEKGHETARVTTAEPKGIESTEGLCEFTVPASLLTPMDE
jgi:hypothetical protein